MKVLLIGRWGKTHALAQALAKSKDVELFSLMDKKNNGIAELCKDYKICDISDIKQIEPYVTEKNIDLLVVVPEFSLNRGVTDYFSKKGLPCVGPSEFCTKLEGDKGFLRFLMKENNIDAYPDFQIFYDKEKAAEFISNYPKPVAVKPAGVTEGDGVKVVGKQLKDKEEAIAYAEEIFDKAIGELPSVLIEERIEGEEYTLQLFCDGENILHSPAIRDYKLLNEGDSGLNTPGMGSYSSQDHLLPFLTYPLFDESIEIIRQILDAMLEKYNERFKGFLSGQYMLTEDGIKLIEINVRPGDSEILNTIPLLETDFGIICEAIATGTLDSIDISFKKLASVCKYVVPEGFPTPTGLAEVHIDREKIENAGAHLFQSCFEQEENLYQPSPRLFAVTGLGETIEGANEKCEEGLSGITGKGLFHRRDIGTPDLTYQFEKYDFIKE